MDGDDPSGWKEANLEPPSSLLRAMVQRSGCFNLVDRGSGLSAAQHERDIGGGHWLKRRSSLGLGQIKAADYVLVAEAQAGNSGGIGGLLGGSIGGIVSGVSSRKMEANVVLSITDVRTTETIAEASGYARKSNVSFGAGNAGPPFAGLKTNSGYQVTDIGRVHARAYLEAFTKLVDDVRAVSAVNDPLVTGASDSPFLPWPPPAPSGIGDVTASFEMVQTLGGIEAQIRARLTPRGYERLHHFSVPGGFGVTTDVERIERDGSPARERWQVGKLPTKGGLFQYITDLFVGNEGKFRLFAFLVTDQDPAPANFKATQMDIDRWKMSGRPFLSRQLALAKARAGTRVWLFVYEFEQSKSKGGKLVAPDQDGLPYSTHAKFLGLK